MNIKIFLEVEHEDFFKDVVQKNKDNQQGTEIETCSENCSY